MGQETIKRGQAGYVLSMVRNNMENLPDWPLPEGYSFYPMRQDDIGLWVDIQKDAEPYFSIDHGMYYQSFGGDIQKIGTRCFILRNEKGVAVGTVSAWFIPDFHGVSYGQVHWVAIRNAFQGLGLGKALMSFVMFELSQHHERAYLGTQSARIPAIHLYLNCGFVPCIDCEESELGWREVAKNLTHPVLENLEKYRLQR